MTDAAPVPYLTTREVAALLRVHRMKVYAAVAAGRLRAFKTNTRGDLRFAPAWVHAFAEQEATRLDATRDELATEAATLRTAAATRTGASR